MSRVGKKPIELPKEVTASVADGVFTAKGKQGELKLRIPVEVAVKIADGRIEVSADPADTIAKSKHGTIRTLIANMVTGLQKPYVKELEIQGVGFKANLQGQKLVLSLGFSHPIDFPVPAGITVAVKDGTAITITGADKHMVGDVAARIRSYFPAEPYKGKGVRYKGEHVRRKAGKAVA